MRLLSYHQLRDRGVPYTREHLRRLIADNRFPAPVALSNKRIAWVESEVSDWIADLAARRPQHEKRAA
jgi:prophage regulatory protein